MERSRVMRQWILLGIIGLGVAWGVSAIFRHLLFEMQVFHSGDTSLFVTVGRGILHGLLPYRDLLETKPPGIFLVVALSLWIGKNLLLVRLAQCAVILAAGFFAGWVIFDAGRNAPEGNRWLRWGIAILFGLTVAQYVGIMGGELFPESFGAAGALCFLLLLTVRRQRWTMREMLLGALAIAWAIGFKEPFVLTILAVALIVEREHPRTLLKNFLLPLSIALAAGTILMAVLGYLLPYLTIDLPLLTGPHLHHIEPRWIGGFLWDTLLLHLGAYSPALLIIVIAASVTLIADAWHIDGRRDAVVFVAFLALLFGGSYAVSFIPSDWQAAGAIAYIVALLLLILLGKRHRTIPILCVLIAGYLLLSAPALRGQFLGHHWLFALPGLVAACGVALQRVHSLPGTARNIVLSTIAIALALHLVMARVPAYGERLRESEIIREETLVLAHAIDDVLDRCSKERWMSVTTLPVDAFAYTEHPPLGPIFFQMNFNRNIPMFRESFIRNVMSADLLLAVPPATLPQEAQEHLVTQFTGEPWPCAAEVLAPKNVLFLFRKPS